MDYKALMDAKKAEDAIKESKVSLTKKIKEALKEIKELEDICFNSNHPQVREMYDDVRRIKEILEK